MQSAEALFQAASKAHMEARLDEAYALYKQALAILPTHPELLNRLAQLELGRGRVQAALDLTEASLKAAPHLPGTHMVMALILSTAGLKDDALGYSAKAATLAPDKPTVLLAYANALIATERYEPALKAFQDVLALNADVLEAQMGLGDALQALGRSAEAVVAYDAAAALAPGVPGLAEKRAAAAAASA